jgi:hypothetical protein
MYIVRWFKFILKVGVEDSIVNAAVKMLRFLHEWRVPNRLFNANCEDKFK